MEIPAEFNDIRPYTDEEVPEVVARLLSDRRFKDALDDSTGRLVRRLIFHRAKKFRTSADVQEGICIPMLKLLAKYRCDSFTYDWSAMEGHGENVLYITNHRDIILDSAFLDLVLIPAKKKAVEIAIGDNLLIKPWIEDLVRLNRSFIVRRSASASELLKSSAELSAYIRFVINSKEAPVWIAQREGRAKDSDDRTQKSVLKMLAMSGEGTVIERLQGLHIAPLSITYEYDPCDFLKAMEFQRKRDFPDYVKSQEDDLRNMKTGLFGKKGRVHYCASAPIDDELGELDQSRPRNALLEDAAAIVDRHIFSGYAIFTGNRVALDLLHNSNEQSAFYTEKDKLRFENYIERQLGRINMETPDWEFLRHKLLEMYANPLLNQLSIQQ